MLKKLVSIIGSVALAATLSAAAPAVTFAQPGSSTATATTAAKAQSKAKLTASTKTVSYEKLQGGSVAAGTVSVSGVKGNAKVTYAKAGGDSCLTVNRKTGKVTVKQGTKSDIYTLKVKATVAKTAAYKARTLTKSLKVQVASSSSSFLEQLASLNTVTSVTPIEQLGGYAQRYMVTVEQPVSWNDASAGTFQQRVEVGYQTSDAPTVYYVGGYCLAQYLYGDLYYAGDRRQELTKNYDANQMSIEYRFFGESTPSGLSNDSTELWDHLTVQNAAKDFHHIIGLMSQILPGKRIFTGVSKGGYTTNVQAVSYPNDADAFVSYSAPLCDGTADPAFYKNVYETIGNEGYDADTAQGMRDAITKFQVECIKNRSKLEDKLWNTMLENGYTYRPQMTKEVLYDIAVLEVSVGRWQLGFSVKKLKDIVDMPEGEERLAAMLEVLVNESSADELDPTGFGFAYIVQSATQMGNYKYDFSYLRKALEDAGVKNGLAVTKDMDEDLRLKLTFTEEQQKAFTYDGGVTRQWIINKMKTTKAHVVMMYGGCDPWYGVRIPTNYNPNVHRYVVDRGPHASYIANLNQEDKAECRQILDSWLK